MDKKVNSAVWVTFGYTIACAIATRYELMAVTRSSSQSFKPEPLIQGLLVWEWYLRESTLTCKTNNFRQTKQNKTKKSKKQQQKKKRKQNKKTQKTWYMIFIFFFPELSLIGYRKMWLYNQLKLNHLSYQDISCGSMLTLLNPQENLLLQEPSHGIMVSWLL